MHIRLIASNLILALLLTSCGSPKTTVAADEQQDTVDLGYTEVDKDQFTGSASTLIVDPEKYGNQFSLVDILLRAPGVFIQGSGTNARAYIRGSTGQLAREPLFVVNNVPIAQSLSEMSFLNPHDIARVTVLKGASATTLYGRRGMYGVILIRTRTGG